MQTGKICFNRTFAPKKKKECTDLNYLRVSVLPKNNNGDASTHKKRQILIPKCVWKEGFYSGIINEFEKSEIHWKY